MKCAKDAGSQSGIVFVIVIFCFFFRIEIGIRKRFEAPCLRNGSDKVPRDAANVGGTAFPPSVTWWLAGQRTGSLVLLDGRMYLFTWY